MRIEKLNENKIRIFLGLDDLKAKNIDIHTFMSNSLESQDLFLDMLNMAESEVGFSTRNYKLAIEALASSEGNFIFTITRLQPEVSFPIKKPKFKIKKQSFVAPNRTLSVYCFDNFDDFCEFCNFINESSLKKYIDKFKASLVLYKDKYYLILNNLKLNVPDLKNFSYTISEFATKVKNDELLERMLKEYGKIIISRNAISTCLKYFSNL